MKLKLKILFALSLLSHAHVCACMHMYVDKVCSPTSTSTCINVYNAVRRIVHAVYPVVLSYIYILTVRSHLHPVPH